MLNERSEHFTEFLLVHEGLNDIASYKVIELKKGRKIYRLDTETTLILAKVFSGNKTTEVAESVKRSRQFVEKKLGAIRAKFNCKTTTELAARLSLLKCSVTYVKV